MSRSRHCSCIASVQQQRTTLTWFDLDGKDLGTVGEPAILTPQVRPRDLPGRDAVGGDRPRPGPADRPTSGSTISLAASPTRLTSASGPNPRLARCGRPTGSGSPTATTEGVLVVRAADGSLGGRPSSTQTPNRSPTSWSRDGRPRLSGAESQAGCDRHLDRSGRSGAARRSRFWRRRRQSEGAPLFSGRAMDGLRLATNRAGSRSTSCRFRAPERSGRSRRAALVPAGGAATEGDRLRQPPDGKWYAVDVRSSREAPFRARRSAAALFGGPDAAARSAPTVASTTGRQARSLVGRDSATDDALARR